MLQVWKARKDALHTDLADAERRAKAIQAKLDRLDEAFLFERSIDIDVYDRHAEKLRQELTLLRMNRHASEVEELDVEGILAFAERILPRAADLWVQSSLDPAPAVPTVVLSASAFNYLRPIATGNEGLVDQSGVSWNHLRLWLTHVDALQPVARTLSSTGL